MDRILIAQALNAGLTIITIDHLFASYGVRTVW
jgi:PIN domain nuclease of toxin-antitoxin system